MGVDRTGVTAPHDVAHTLAALRQERGWTLKQLAEATGVSISTLSKLENGQAGGSFKTIMRILRGLELRLESLVDVAPGRAPGRRAICRAGTGLRIDGTHRDYEVFATDLTRKTMMPAITTVRCRTLAEWGELSRHEGEEWLYVLSGVIAVHTEHYAPVTLEKGDGIYIDSAMGHAVLNLGDDAAQVMSVVIGEGEPRLG